MNEHVKYLYFYFLSNETDYRKNIVKSFIDYAAKNELLGRTRDNYIQTALELLKNETDE